MESEVGDNMKCKVCGAESGKYPLCINCNKKKEQGLIIKCPKCNNWHLKDMACPVQIDNSAYEYLYAPRKRLLSKTEELFWDALQKAIPDSYHVFPQINLASFIERTDNSRFRTELFRNIDFLITDTNYTPKIAVEINDQTHLTGDRRERDEKVQNILDEAGIPLIKLWTSYGVNADYIKKKVDEALSAPVIRQHHFNKQVTSAEDAVSQQEGTVDNAGKNTKDKKHGCYIATAIYGSYDCPQVWTLRRFRDFTLSETWWGRLFILIYYFISPVMVNWFGRSRWFSRLWKPKLDKLVDKLNNSGVKDTPYIDRPW